MSKNVRDVLIECDGMKLTPEEFTKEVLERNPKEFTDEDVEVLKRFWINATYER